MTGETPIKTNKTNIETEVDLSSAFSPEETEDSEASKGSAPPVTQKSAEFERPSIWQLALPSILGNLSYTIVPFPLHVPLPVRFD